MIWPKDFGTRVNMAGQQLGGEETVPAMRYTGKFLIDDQGYSLVNDEGQVIAYFGKETCVWSIDVTPFDGLMVELVFLPDGRTSIINVVL
jgi:hypothetical protein